MRNAPRASVVAKVSSWQWFLWMGEEDGGLLGKEVGASSGHYGADEVEHEIGNGMEQQIESAVASHRRGRRRPLRRRFRGSGGNSFGRED